MGSLVFDAILGKSEWADLKDFLTPTVFDVLPPRAAQRQVAELLAGRLRPGDARSARETLAFPGVRATDGRVGPERIEARDEDARRRRGDAVLNLYFHQLLCRETTLLDLRADRFRDADGETTWRPGWLHVRWDPPFLTALRQLYDGFYQDEPGQFDAAIAALALQPARDVFLAHFGGGDQTEVRFERATFVHTFHDAFLACRDAGGPPLHRNFLALGLYLATLYEHLERLGLAFDVRAAYLRARPQRSTPWQA